MENVKKQPGPGLQAPASGRSAQETWLHPWNNSNYPSEELANSEAKAKKCPATTR